MSKAEGEPCPDFLGTSEVLLYCELILAARTFRSSMPRCLQA